MRKTFNLSVVIILFGTLYSAGSAAQSTPAAEKTAGEMYKNIQVLKDIPASDITNTMWFIAGSLGVPCQHCHVVPNESDAKQAKLTARKMIQMTRELNAANFGGKPVVTCNTCHQGNLKPNGVPNYWGKDNKTPEEIAAYIKERQPAPPGQPVPPAQPVSPAPAPATAEPLPSVDTIIENYRKAVGATAVTSIHMIADLDPDVAAPVHLEIYMELPDKFEQTLSGPGIQVRQILNGDHGWIVNQGGTVPLNPNQVKGIKSAIRAMEPFKFSVAETPRTVTGIEKIGDRSYYVIESHTAKNRSLLYFDTQSGLLYKAHGNAFTPLGTYPYETIFSDYRDVNGVKFPGATKGLGSSGGVRYKFTLIETNVPVDPKRFDAPAPPSPK